VDRAVKIVRAIFPKAKPEYVASFDAGDAQLAAAGITTPLRLAHLLAQCGAGSGGLTLTRESLNYTTEARLQQIFDDMRLTKPLLPGEVEILLRQEKDLDERFYGVSQAERTLPAERHRRRHQSRQHAQGQEPWQ
jgi:putative chitinase